MAYTFLVVQRFYNTNIRMKMLLRCSLVTNVLSSPTVYPIKANRFRPANKTKRERENKYIDIYIYIRFLDAIDMIKHFTNNHCREKKHCINGRIHGGVYMLMYTAILMELSSLISLAALEGFLAPDAREWPAAVRTWVQLPVVQTRGASLDPWHDTTSHSDKSLKICF